MNAPDVGKDLAVEATELATRISANHVLISWKCLILRKVTNSYSLKFFSETQTFPYVQHGKIVWFHAATAKSSGSLSSSKCNVNVLFTSTTVSPAA
jgi:hypothetical protein